MYTASEDLELISKSGHSVIGKWTYTSSVLSLPRILSTNPATISDDMVRRKEVQICLMHLEIIFKLTRSCHVILSCDPTALLKAMKSLGDCSAHWQRACAFLILINSMPKCIGCKKDFKSQGFPAHKKSCKPFKREIKARLNNVANSGGILVEDTVTEEVADLGDMFANEVQPEVCYNVS